MTKRNERYDGVPDETETILYRLGYLDGEWPDGTPFDNTAIDRLAVRDGLIIDTDVCNDGAE
ncbi:hypothetical protein [Agrobacterium tumefaciens]|uniref:hypothetical protein n=1 Tax=Agrobacterium tumefaciens TaxID=358 RepID=UPI0021D17A23|nr:hypothetical protein [Agrobacterium tumefaciens]